MECIAWLQANTTRVVHHSLTNERHMAPWISRSVREPHQSWRLHTSLIHSEEPTATHLFEIVLIKDFDVETMRGCQIGNDDLKVTSVEMCRRCVRKITSKVRRPRTNLALSDTSLDGCRSRRDNGQ